MALKVRATWTKTHAKVENKEVHFHNVPDAFGSHWALLEENPAFKSAWKGQNRYIIRQFDPVGMETPVAMVQKPPHGHSTIQRCLSQRGRCHSHC